MGLFAASHVSSVADSKLAATELGKHLQASFSGEPLRAVLVYSTVNHDQHGVLMTLRELLGPDVPLLGCSTPGIMYLGGVQESAYMLGVMGLGGADLQVATALVRDVQDGAEEKGRILADALRAQLPDPKVVFLFYDPLCGLDVETLLDGMSPSFRCPIVGGGAGQPWGPIARTFQYWQSEVMGHTAIALALAGPFAAEIGVCHGTSPTGVEMTLTRAEGNKLIEIDGRSATDIWLEITGCNEEEINNQDYVSAWAVGVEQPLPDEKSVYVIRAAFGFDLDTGEVLVQAAIPEGTNIMFHHRSVAEVTQGTAAMGQELAERVSGRRPWAVLGFECAARTQAFLGQVATNAENVALQAAVAPGAPWLGMLAWGEIAPAGGATRFHNYTFPLAVLTAEQ